MKRNRLLYLILILVTLLIGLASRKYPEYFTDFLAEYLGDTLWALLVFWGFGFVFQKKSIAFIAISTLTFSFSIELSQLYQALWIENIRNTTLGALVLGHGFLWSDLICYIAGVGLGVGIEVFIINNQRYRD